MCFQLDEDHAMLKTDEADASKYDECDDGSGEAVI